MEREKATDTTTERYDADGGVSEEGQEELTAMVVEMAGSVGTSAQVELGSYDYYQESYEEMDWAPEGAA